MGKPGRPSRLTEAMLTDLVKRATMSTSYNNLAPQVGITPGTLDEWRALGKKVNAYEAKVAKGVRIVPEYRMEVTPHGKRCGRLVQQLDVQMAESLRRLERAAMTAATIGSVETTTETRQVLEGAKIIELHTVREKRTGPDARTALEIMARRFPGWQPRQEVSGPDGAPISFEVSADSVLRLIQRVSAGELVAPDDVIDVEGEEVEDSILAQLDQLEG